MVTSPTEETSPAFGDWQDDREPLQPKKKEGTSDNKRPVRNAKLRALEKQYSTKSETPTDIEEVRIIHYGLGMAFIMISFAI
jgi:hypothetical protein